VPGRQDYICSKTLYTSTVPKPADKLLPYARSLVIGSGRGQVSAARDVFPRAGEDNDPRDVVVRRQVIRAFVL
jgi:hypothetical protein